MPRPARNVASQVVRLANDGVRLLLEQRMAPSNRVAPDGQGHGEDGSSGEKRGDKGKKSPAGKLAAPGERDQKGKGSPSQGRIQGAGASRLKNSGSASEKQSPLGGGGPIGSRPPGPRQPVSAMQCNLVLHAPCARETRLWHHELLPSEQ